MLTNVYFIRHAESNHAIHDDIIRPLTQKGEMDAKKVADYLEDKSIDIIISSPYKRAIDTLKPYAKRVGLQIATVNDFRERRIDSCWIEDFRGFSQKQWADFDYKLSDGESLNEVQCRNISALKKVLRDNAGKNIVIGSHGTALSTVINYYESTYCFADFEEIRNVMPWIVKFTFEDEFLKSITKIDILGV